ncbi:MAG: tetratricopeptide repeat protein, partial [Pedobacter sp.]
DFNIFIYNDAGVEVLKYNPSDNADREFPAAAKPALLPEDLETVEQLFLTGQHLEQYRHATYLPMPYYLEGIKREPNDIRCNNAIGLWMLKKGLFEESLSYFKTAIASITNRNPNPYNCEPYFNYGLANLYLGRVDDAYNSFFKSAWDKSFQDAAYYHIAQIDLQRKDYANCLEHIDWALDRNARNGKAYLIKILCLKKLGKKKEARVVMDQVLAKDIFNLAVLFEKYQLFKLTGDEQNATTTLNELKKLSGGTSHNAIEYAIDYIQAGFYEQAIEFIKLVAPTKLHEPLLNYYLAYAFNKLENEDAVAKHLWVAKAADSSYCFPNRLFDILVLEYAIKTNDRDAKAPYYLANLFYDKQQYNKAIELWETSASLDNTFATVFRNLGLAYYNKRKNPVKALEHYELAYSLNKNDSRVVMELDSLYKKLNKDAEFRLQFLKDNSVAVLERDDLYLEQITIHNFLGNYQLAYDLLMARKFHPWEGGEGKVPEQYKTAIIGLAKKNIVEGKFEKAIEFLTAAQTYPDNLGEGKLVGTQENDIFYWLGNCYELLGDLVEAENYWKQAATGLGEPGMAMFYNDQQPDKIFYQGYALQKLGEAEKARAIFHKLINYGEANLNEQVKLDYFAVSLPDLLIFEGDLSERNTIHCLYLSALGYFGLGEVAKAINLFNQILAKEALHYGAQLHLAMAQSVVLT